MSDIRQFKLSSGQEIICKVLEWPDEEVADMIITNVVEVIGSDYNDGVRYYSFKPFMVMQEGRGLYLNLNADKILCEAAPVPKLLEYYEKALADVDEKQREEGRDPAKELEEWIDKLRAQVEARDSEDSAGNKVVRFPGKDKLH